MRPGGNCADLVPVVLTGPRGAGLQAAEKGAEAADQFVAPGRSKLVTPQRGHRHVRALVDFITSLDGYASGEGWPGFWGLEGPEYLAWLGEQPEVTYLMGANTYRLMSGFAAGEVPSGQDELRLRGRGVR